MAKLNLLERVSRKKRTNTEMGIVLSGLQNKQDEYREHVFQEVRSIFNEVESTYEEIQKIKESITKNTLLELLIIHKKIKFPTSKPSMPVFNAAPLEFKANKEESLVKFSESLAVALSNVFGKEKSSKKVKEVKRKREERKAAETERKRKYYRSLEEYKNNLDDFKEESLIQLEETKLVLSTILKRLDRLKKIVETNYSDVGPEFIDYLSSGVTSVFTMPFLGIFDVIDKKKNVHIKIGAANPSELKERDDDIPQLMFKISSPMDGGALIYSFELSGDLEIAFDIQRETEFARGSIGQSASITIFNEVILAPGAQENDMFGQTVSSIDDLSKVLEIPLAFATELHIAEDIAARLVLITKGVINVKPQDILQALIEASEKTRTNGSSRLREILEYTKKNSDLYYEWAKFGAFANAELLASMNLGDNVGVRKLILMLRTGAIKYPWHLVVCTLAVSEGRHDLLTELQKGSIGPSQLFSMLGSSKHMERLPSNGALGLLEDVIDGEVIGEESSNQSSSVELSSTGVEVLKALGGERYNIAELVPLRKVVPIILTPEFQAALVNKKSMEERSVLLDRIGKLISDIRNAKLQVSAEELQLEYDSWVQAAEDFRSVAKDLKPEIAGAIVSALEERAKKISRDIPDFGDTSEISTEE